MKKTNSVKVMRILLFQIRNGDDPMLAQEFQCFTTKLVGLQDTFSVHLDSHNIIDRPAGYRKLWPEYDAVFVGGSGDYGCVNNHSPWYLEFCQVLRDIVEADKPMFCSCFGHQALAAALGGEVATDRSKSELGTLEVTLNEEGRNDRLLGQVGSPFWAQFGHNDFVSRLPENAVNMASTPLCRVQSYKLKGKLVYSTQFHPELSREQNLERAQRYMSVYDPSMTSSEKIAAMFRASEPASSLLPKFLELVHEAR